MDYKELVQDLLDYEDLYSDLHPSICDRAAAAVTDLLARAEKAEREMDAAIKDINEILALDEMCPLQCAWCKWADNCDGTKLPEWRGLKEA